MIELLNQITARMTVVKEIHLDIERFSVEKSTIQDVEQFLRDMRLPSVVTSMGIGIYGTPTINMLFEEEYASYDIRRASDMDEARQIEDQITSFFEKHKTFRFASFFPALAIGVILGAIGSFEILFYAKYLMLQRTLPYSSLHLFVGLVCFTFIVYMLWSSLTPETPSFSFVHSIMFMKEKQCLMGIII